MTPVNDPKDFPEANAHFGPPPGLDEAQVKTVLSYCGPVPGGSLDGEKLVVVAWRPNAAELAELNAGGLVYMTAIGGLPAHFLSASFAAAVDPA